MRELKFRAWIPEKYSDDVMIYSDYRNGKDYYFGFDAYGQLEITEYIADKASNRCIPDVRNDAVIMQYTGLKDKNGKEIYEDDIVQVLDCDMKINPRDSDTGYGVIEWLDAMGGWYIDRIHNSLMDIDRDYTIIVVGNIYENPELLEDTA